MLAVVAGGCARRGRGYTRLATLDETQVERLRRLGERDMNCARAALAVVPMAHNAVELRGCERIREYALVCRGRRCNWQPMIPAALLATRDFHCSLEAMSVTAPTPTTRDLVGCGQAGRYTLNCADDAVCRWQLLSPVVPVAAMAPPPSYSTGRPEAPTVVSGSASVSTDEIPPPPTGNTAPR